MEILMFFLILVSSVVALFMAMAISAVVLLAVLCAAEAPSGDDTER